MTFRDPESARRACADPTPIIDGRRANCNLASLGRPGPSLPFGITFLSYLLPALVSSILWNGLIQPPSYLLLNMIMSSIGSNNYMFFATTH